MRYCFGAKPVSGRLGVGVVAVGSGLIFCFRCFGAWGVIAKKEIHPSNNSNDDYRDAEYSSSL